MHGATIDDAKNYFEIVGCQTLSGMGTGFYYVDWDQDAPMAGKPSFGLFNFNGQAQFTLDCSKFKKEQYVTKGMPSFVGGDGLRVEGAQ